MADNKSKDNKSKDNKSKDSKTKSESVKSAAKVRKASSSMRDSSAKSRAKAEKPKKIRKAAGAAKRPFKSVAGVLSKEYHLIKPKKDDKFMTKSRKFTPSYFRSAWTEVKFVKWPGRKETWKLVLAVFIFALVLGVIIAVTDYLLEKILRTIIF